MIFVTLGSQKFQMNRVLKELDDLVKRRLINEDIYAQVGYSDYRPKNFEARDFFLRQEYLDFMEKAKLIITHGGTGAIVGALKKEKKVIAIPRQSKLGEHVDDHQYEIVNLFAEKGLIVTIDDEHKLIEAIDSIESKDFNKFISQKEEMLDSIRITLKQIN